MIPTFLVREDGKGGWIAEGDTPHLSYRIVNGVCERWEVKPLTVSATPAQPAAQATQTPPSAEQVEFQRVGNQFGGKIQAAFTAACGNTGSCSTCGDTAHNAMLLTWRALPDAAPWLAIHAGSLRAWLTGKVPLLDDAGWERALEAFKAAGPWEPIPEIPLGVGRLFSAMIKEATGEDARQCRRCYDHAIQMNEWGYIGSIRRWKEIYGWLAHERELRNLPVDAKVIGRAIRGAFKVWKSQK